MPRNYHIMVVEDDLAVRQIMTHQIRQAGYRASDFTTGKRAIDALNEMQARGQSIDLLVLDLGLPDMLGIELLQEFRKKNFDAPVIGISGKADKDSIRELVEQGGIGGFLLKPFSPKDLINRIRAVVSGKARASC